MGVWQIRAGRIYLIKAVQNLRCQRYLFGLWEVSPVQYVTDSFNEISEKYSALNDESKKIVDNLIEQLLSMQENQKQ